jgi:hypothetical protein
MGGSSETPLPLAVEAAYQAEVARRARMTSEELAADATVTTEPQVLTSVQLVAGTPTQLLLLDEANQPEHEILLHYIYGGQTIRVSVPRSAFQVIEPGADLRHQEDIVRRNLPRIEPVVEGKRASGEIKQWTSPVTGQSLPLIELSEAEIDQAIERRQVTADFAATIGVAATPGATPLVQVSAQQAARIGSDAAEIFALAIYLEKLARDRIELLRGSNDPATIDERDLLTILADGLAQIAAALQAFANEPQPVFLGQAGAIVNSLAEQLGAWWEANKSEATDWIVRVPIMVGATELFHMAGANMFSATAAIVGLVGGPKAVQTYRALRDKGPKKD